MLDAANWGDGGGRWDDAGIRDLYYPGIHNNFNQFSRDCAAAYQLSLVHPRMVVDVVGNKLGAEGSKRRNHPVAYFFEAFAFRPVIVVPQKFGCVGGLVYLEHNKILVGVYHLVLEAGTATEEDGHTISAKTSSLSKTVVLSRSRSMLPSTT